MTYLTPSEREATMVDAFDALLDDEDQTLAGIRTMAQDGLDDGNREVMRACLSTIVAWINDLIADGEAP